MKLIFKYFKTTDWVFVSLSALCIVAQVVLEMALPAKISEVSTLVSTGAGVSDVLGDGMMMLLFVFGALIFAAAGGFMTAKVSSNFTERMRSDFFARTMSFSVGEVGRFSSSSLITRCTADILLLQTFFSTGVQTIVKAPVTAVIGIQRMSGADQMLAWATVIAVVVICIYLAAIIIRTIPLSVRSQTIADNMNRETKEHISGIQVIRAFLAEGFHRERFTSVNEEMRVVNTRLDRIMAFLNPGLVLMLNMLNLAIVVIGALMVSKTDLALRATEISNILSYSSYAIMIVSAFVMLVQIFMIMPRFITSTRRIKEVMDTETAIKDGSFEGELPDTDVAVEFRNVCFRYSNDASNVLENISFKVKKGETVAIIGATGSGKTTLANLIPRLYDASEGSVLVNGVDVRERKIGELRNGIGYVPQKSMLFTGSVASNIDYGSNGKLAATLSEIKKAAEIGQSKEFIERLNEKYDAAVASGGTNFSGGQRQRLTISRAICRDPEIYIFDDSFSALDFKTDRILRSKLRENAKGSTFIIIAQRIGTIRNADNIIVLDNGAVAGIGKHSELLGSCPIYREIALSQLSEEEAAGI